MGRINTEKDIWESCVIKDNGCWEWSKSRTPRGYGKSHFGGKEIRAHRLAFLLTNGYLPKAVCHSCDNPPCVNPSHLFAGDNKINTLDSKAKNRRWKPKGTAHPHNKYSDDTIKSMRQHYSNGMSLKEIAASSGIHAAYVRQIVNKIRWRHIE